MDAFILGFRIPNLTRDLFAEGALSSAFVPIFTKYLTTKGKEEARELYNLVATGLILIVGRHVPAGHDLQPATGGLFASGFTRFRASSNWPCVSPASCSRFCCWWRWRRKPWVC